jgi:hypothetical protein
MKWRECWAESTKGYSPQALGRYAATLDSAESLCEIALSVSPIKAFRSWLMELVSVGLLTDAERASISFIHTSCIPHGTKFE